MSDYKRMTSDYLFKHENYKRKLNDNFPAIIFLNLGIIFNLIPASISLLFFTILGYFFYQKYDATVLAIFISPLSLIVGLVIFYKKRSSQNKNTKSVNKEKPEDFYARIKKNIANLVYGTFSFFNEIKSYAADMASMTIEAFLFFLIPLKLFQRPKIKIKNITSCEFNDLPLEHASNRILVVSDVHVTTNKNSIEGHSINNLDTFKRFYRAYTKARYDSIFICGDITDTGAPREWYRFNKAIKRSKISTPIFIAPGNHDFNITHGGKFRCEVYSKHARRLRVIRYLHSASSANTNLKISNSSSLLSTWLEENKTKLSNYLKNPLKFTGPTMEELESLFPLFVDTTERLTVIVNSNRNSSNILTNGFGEIGQGQLSKLNSIIQNSKSKFIYILLHHHIVKTQPAEWYIPAEGWEVGFINKAMGRVVRFFKSHLRRPYIRLLQPWFLVCLDSSKLMDVLAQYTDRNIICVHGHKHIGDRYKAGHIEIISSFSTAFGDEANNKDFFDALKIVEHSKGIATLKI